MPSEMTVWHGRPSWCRSFRICSVGRRRVRRATHRAGLAWWVVPISSADPPYPACPGRSVRAGSAGRPKSVPRVPKCSILFRPIRPEGGKLRLLILEGMTFRRNHDSDSGKRRRLADPDRLHAPRPMDRGLLIPRLRRIDGGDRERSDPVGRPRKSVPRVPKCSEEFHSPGATGRRMA